MRPIIYPYNMGSRTAGELADSLPGSRRVYPDRNYRPYPSHLIINWGCSRWPDWNEDPITPSWLNKPHNVEYATNKLSALEILEDNEIPIPAFTSNGGEAYEWDSGVMVRRVLTSHSGRGALYVNKDDRELLIGSLSGAPLYTKYIKKSSEYRVHVFQGSVIDQQQKRLREGSEGNDFQIRSFDNGWVFCRDNVNLGDNALSLAVRSVAALGLDFGAVDIVFNSHYNEYFVLEVNTAPGLVGATLDSYSNAIRGIL